MHHPKDYTHSFPSISRPNEEFQLPGWAGGARTVGIFHPVMLARVINCALPWDQWTCHLGIVHLYISPPLHTHTLFAPLILLLCVSGPGWSGGPPMHPAEWTDPLTVTNWWLLLQGSDLYASWRVPREDREIRQLCETRRGLHGPHLYAGFIRVWMQMM